MSECCDRKKFSLMSKLKVFLIVFFEPFVLLNAGYMKSSIKDRIVSLSPSVKMWQASELLLFLMFASSMPAGKEVRPLTLQGGQEVRPLTSQEGQEVKPWILSGGQEVKPWIPSGGQEVRTWCMAGGMLDLPSPLFCACREGGQALDIARRSGGQALDIARRPGG